MHSVKSRVMGTVILGVCWLVFIVLYLAFFAGHLDFLQKAAVFIASAAIVGGVVAVMWIRWALK